ncbi:hypothetical protein SCP_0802690 [Sparassis crispa]|uniref:Uncharacterized protein n=1 Tax=Sparassis crispa TaxID=139825 RepID=A0A401GU54_9APHY|nr:hypothetical protein SCP_0802690 [Sparassis crispa]GBE85747.1 hypothetical protein SCP_0802690 [Sparassis crispa]
MSVYEIGAILIRILHRQNAQQKYNAKHICQIHKSKGNSCRDNENETSTG